MVVILIATGRNGTGMDLWQRDGTGLVVIFIPVSLSNVNPALFPHVLYRFSMIFLVS